MDLLVVRHAIAEDREALAASGRDDAERRLTADGRRRFEQGARGIHRLVDPVDVLATSTLARAIETGEILAATCGIRRAVRLEELAPDAAPASLLPWLREHRARATVAIVGHDPHLSRLVECLLVGRQAGFIGLGKGGACLLELGESPEPGGAALRWLLTPSQLRRVR